MSELQSGGKASPLDEQTRRRDPWGGGEPIGLLNGQRWYFPQPSISVVASPDCHLELLACINDAIDGGQTRRVHATASAAAIRLLIQNYCVSLEEAAGLIPPFNPGEPSLEWMAILGVIAGTRRDRTLNRWLRVTLLINGVRGPIGLADAWDLAAILEATGRTVPRRKWVDEFREEDDASNTLIAML